MTVRIPIAIIVGVAMMLVGLVSPLAVTITGTTVYLETEPVDPRSLFRGDYVILGYTAGQNILNRSDFPKLLSPARPIYVTLSDDRPARFISSSLESPDLEEGQVCLVGRARFSGDQGSVEFPQIGQYFVPEGQGRAIETQLGDSLLAKVKVTDRCRAVLVGLEPR